MRRPGPEWRKQKLTLHLSTMGDAGISDRGRGTALPSAEGQDEESLGGEGKCFYVYSFTVRWHAFCPCTGLL